MNSLHKKIIAGVAIVVFIGVFTYWGTGFIYDLSWGRSSEEREALIKEIENNQKILENRTEIDYSLEQQVKDAEYELDLQLEEFSEDIDIPELINELFSLADQNTVTVIPLRTTNWASASRSGYDVYRFQIQIEGDTDNIIKFINDLETSSVSTIVTAGLQLSGESIGEAEEPSEVAGSLQVLVYRRS